MTNVRSDIRTGALPVFVHGLVVTETLVTWESSEPWPDDAPPWTGTERLLDDFCDLARATEPSEVETFIRRYGIPELCSSHGLPLWHNDTCRLATSLRVQRLRRRAKAFGALRNIGSALSRQRVGAPSDWVDIQALTDEILIPKSTEGVTVERLRAAEVVTRLLRDCGVRPRVEWGRTGKPMMTWEADGLMGTLAILLYREIGHTRPAYPCDGCGQSVERAKAPRPEQRTWCGSVGCRRIRDREAAQRHRDAQAGKATS